MTIGEQDITKPTAGSSRPVVRASSIRKTRLCWTWRGRLALGYLAVWCGAGDLGKSMFAAWVIRNLTYGDVARRVPRHAAERADRVHRGRQGRHVAAEARGGRRRPRPRRVPRLSPRLEPQGRRFVHRQGGRNGAEIPLVFIDALMSHMPDAHGGENTRSPTFVRAALEPLADLCKQRKVTGLFGLHPRKAGGDTFADVVQESGVFTQLPRLGLLFGYHPDDLELPRDQQRRVIIRAKGNVGRNPGALSFRIAEKFLDWGDDDPEGVADGVGYITDVQSCHVTERQLLHSKPAPGDRPPTNVERATELIGMALCDGQWHPAAPIRSRLASIDPKLDHNATVDKATADLKVQKRKQGGALARPVGVANSPLVQLDPKS